MFCRSCMCSVFNWSWRWRWRWVLFSPDCSGCFRFDTIIYIIKVFTHENCIGSNRYVRIADINVVWRWGRLSNNSNSFSMVKFRLIHFDLIILSSLSSTLKETFSFFFLSQTRTGAIVGRIVVRPQTTHFSFGKIIIFTIKTQIHVQIFTFRKYIMKYLQSSSSRHM